MEGVDFAGSRPSGLCLWAGGKRFAGRYFGPGGAWKHATPAEVRGLVASGIAVVALAEGDERDPLGGYTVGRAHAISAAAAVRSAGISGDRPIYFAVDFDASDAEMAKVGAYLDGAAHEIGPLRVGIYAGYRQVRWANQHGKARWFFQTYAWSAGQWFFGNHFEQYRNKVTVCGGQVDLCRSKRADFGQWPAPVTTGGSEPPPPPDSTVTTPWEFTDLIGDLAATFQATASTVGSAAAAMERLT